MKKSISLITTVFLVSTLMLTSCKKEEIEKNNKGKITNQKEGNAEGTISFKLNGKNYEFNIYEISITEENPSVLYRFLISGESQTQSISMYVYQNELGEYICGSSNFDRGTFNITIVEKKDNAMSVFYISAGTCRLGIDKLENYQFMRYEGPDFFNRELVFAGSLGLLEASFSGNNGGYDFKEGKLTGKIK
jgi:hypothetical protein